jgi:hypothetical protein
VWASQSPNEAFASLILPLLLLSLISPAEKSVQEMEPYEVFNWIEPLMLSAVIVPLLVLTATLSPEIFLHVTEP